MMILHRSHPLYERVIRLQLSMSAFNDLFCGHSSASCIFNKICGCTTTLSIRNLWDGFFSCCTTMLYGAESNYQHTSLSCETSQSFKNVFFLQWNFNRFMRIQSSSVTGSYWHSAMMLWMIIMWKFYSRCRKIWWSLILWTLQMWMMQKWIMMSWLWCIYEAWVQLICHQSDCVWKWKHLLICYEISVSLRDSTTALT